MEISTQTFFNRKLSGKHGKQLHCPELWQKSFNQSETVIFFYLPVLDYKTSKEVFSSLFLEKELVLY